jgi:hypothetical protein
MARWSVKFREGEWRVYDGQSWADRFPTLTETHTAATQSAIAAELCAPGGLTRWRAWRDIVFARYEWVWDE